MKNYFVYFTSLLLIFVLQSCIVVNDSNPNDNTIQKTGSYCQDKSYTENTVFPNADISSFVDNYTPGNAIQFRSDVLSARYPMGEYITQTSHDNGACDDYWNNPGLTGNATAAEEIKALSTVVHECGHGLDSWLTDWTSGGYFINPDITLHTEDGYAHIENDHPSFANYLLQSDEYGTDSWKECEPDVWEGCDFYADTYLANDFMGNQGFETITEEVTQYINSLALGYAFQEFYTNGT